MDIGNSSSWILRYKTSFFHTNYAFNSIKAGHQKMLKASRNFTWDKSFLQSQNANV